MSMPSKIQIPVAVPGKTKKVYSQQHLTTVGFMKPRPIFSREYIPGRDMKVNTKSYLRANPMPVPILGTARVFNRAFFVPFRSIFPAWDEFYTSSVYPYIGSGNDKIPTIVPSIGNVEFIHLFENSLSTRYALVTAGTSSNYDIVVGHAGGSPSFYLLTDKGIDFLTILESLGYKINWRDDDTFVHSALPLFAYCKVIMDWYYPSAYVGDSAFQFVARIFNSQVDALSVDETMLIGISDVILNPCCYNSDYFVSAWDNPTAPNSINYERSIQIPDITNNGTFKQSAQNYDTGGSPTLPGTKPNNGTPFVGSNNTTSSTLAAGSVTTQYVIDALKSLTDYTKRHQLAGVRALDRYLAELGINLSNEILKRSMYLGTQEFSIEFYDVFSHADTVNGNNGAQLGAYAGKGNGFSGAKEFSFDNGQEFGMFLIVNSLMPQIGYYQGQHRENMHLQCLDFYHPDFDHMAVQPISCREVFVSQNGQAAVAQNGLNTQIFGFVPKYIEYNTPMDLQTGLFRVKSQHGLLPFYSLMRDLSFYEQGTLAAMKHNYGFVIGNDAGQYDRIFYDALLHYNFIAAHEFDVTCFDSTLPAYDTYEFDHEENRKVELEINGSKLN